MDQLLHYLPELLGAAGALWGARERLRRSKAEAARVALAAAKAALEVRLEAVSEIGVRFAEALERRDYAQVHAIERERKARGL